MGRLARWRGLAAVGIRSTLARLRGGGQPVVSVLGVAVVIGLLLTVTSIGIGLATGGVVSGSGASYVITPAEASGSVVADVEAQQLGRVHAATDRIESFDGVRWATPVLVTIASLEGAPTERLLVVGVVPDEGMSVAGLSTAPLTPGDPLATGGTRTGEAVVSATASEELGYRAGDALTLGTGAATANRSFEVVAVREPTEPGLGQLPVAVVHLRELQTLTGGTEADVAGRLLVAGSGDGLEARLAGVYPEATVRTQSGLLRQQVFDSQLTLAVGVGAFVVTTVVGVLFIATTMGFELAAERTDRRVMRAVGVSTTSRALVVAVRTGVVCLLGGLAGVVLWLLAVGVVNAVARWVSGGVAIAVTHPALAGLGLLAAVAIGLLASPYLLVVGLRGDEVVP